MPERKHTIYSDYSFSSVNILSENKPLEQKEIMSMKCVTYPDKSDPVVADHCIEWILYGFDFKALMLCFTSST